jgi:hypothetical protein
MKKTIIILLFMHSLVGCSQGESEIEEPEQQISCENLTGQMEVDNGILNVKLDLTRGGAINYISASGKTRNIVNIHDEGRYIQQSYYAGNRLDRTVGDVYRNRAEILECSTLENTLYTKCIPMQWDMNNRPAEATMEQWVTLVGNVIKVRNKLTCYRTDDIYGENIPRAQELPAVYPISALKNLYSYFGTSPFTGDPLDNPEVEHLEDGFWGRYQDEMVTEHWMAFVDDENWGIGVYTPIASNFLAGMAGAPGFESTDGPTSYIAPIKTVALKKKDIFEYDYYLIIGDLNEIRSKIYELNQQN